MYNYSYYSDYELSSYNEPYAAGLIILFVVIYFLVLAAMYVIFALLLGQIFKKAGVERWIAWVPFYNNWKLLELGGQQGFWAVLSIIPFVNIASAVFMYIAMYHIGLKLNKSGAFVLWAIFLPVVWYIWLALDSSKWDEKKSAAKAL